MDATLPHEQPLLWLMETDIRKNVRECVWSFEKVRYAAEDAVRARVCVRAFVWCVCDREGERGYT